MKQRPLQCQDGVSYVHFEGHAPLLGTPHEAKGALLSEMRVKMENFFLPSLVDQFTQDGHNTSERLFVRLMTRCMVHEDAIWCEHEHVGGLGSEFVGLGDDPFPIHQHPLIRIFWEHPSDKALQEERLRTRKPNSDLGDAPPDRFQNPFGKTYP